MASGDSSLPSTNNLSYVKHVVIVMSGKGGVGKSTVASHLAVTLQKTIHKRVGLLDTDLCGPSIAKLFGVEKSSIVQTPSGWNPVSISDAGPGESVENGNNGQLLIMSIAFLIPDRDQAVIWRGPKKQSMIKTFLQDVNWADKDNPLDYLVIDTPPGTSDEHISVVEALTKLRSESGTGNNSLGALLVTTPQMLAINDVRRQITFCKKTNLKIIGLVENMSGYVCPHCSECTSIFSAGGGEQLAQLAGVKFLGRIPINASIADACDKGLLTEITKLYDPSSPILQIARDLQDLNAA